MEEMILGYQYSPVDNKFIGEYRFWNNLDKEEIHMPPNTILVAPPDVSGTNSAYWENGEWVVKHDPSKVVYIPQITDYSLLMPGFVEHLKQIGQWSAEDQTKYEESRVTIQNYTNSDTTNGN